MLHAVYRGPAHGYYGGVRLLRALCFKFHDHCRARGLPLHGRGRVWNMSPATSSASVLNPRFLSEMAC